MGPWGAAPGVWPCCFNSLMIGAKGILQRELGSTSLQNISPIANPFFSVNFNTSRFSVFLT